MLNWVISEPKIILHANLTRDCKVQYSEFSQSAMIWAMTDNAIAVYLLSLCIKEYLAWFIYERQQTEEECPN